MGGLRHCVPLLALAWLAAACSEQDSNVATSPSFARPSTNSCSFTTISNLAKDEFGASSNEVKLAGDMKTYGAGTAQATYVGYKLLDAIAVKYEIAANQASTTTASQLAVALPPCMNVGSASIPTSFEDELGTTGAFGVRGWPDDARPVRSHQADGTKAKWTLEPPSGLAWEDITTLATTGLPDSVKNLFLAFGKPVSASGFTGDQLVSNVFDWNTIPVAEFSGVGVVIGECNLASNFIQHNAGSDAEVLGFVRPSCGSLTSATERAPSTLAERFVRLLAPKPLYATTLLSSGTGSTGKRLSPFGVVFPGVVNLDDLFTWKKSGNTVGVPFSPPPKYQILSSAGTEFKQDFVLIYLQAVGNNGVNVEICNNYAFTNADGIAQFPQAYLNKAGGYTIFAFTTGTVSKPGVGEGETPTVPAGQSLPSGLVNVKNGTQGACSGTWSPGQPLPEPPGPNGFAPLQGQ
jgi:hypothetical protein